MHPNSSRSTCLENVRLKPDGARFDLEGRQIRLRSETEPDSVAALRSFYEVALRDAEGGAPKSRPGLFSRLRSWLGRLFSDSVRAEPPLLGAPVAPPPQAPPPKPMPARPAEAGPKLQAVFGDAQGVHVQWNMAEGKSPDRLVERRYAANSELGLRLQDCYGHLAQLGFGIVGLDLKPIGPAGPARESPAPPAPALRRSPEVETRKAPEAKSPTCVVRLLPEASDHPGKALTAPFLCAENIQPLAGPDRLVSALRAAAEPSRPDAESLTCLRCSLAKTGLKVVAVGLGQTKSGEPARWEDVGPWLERQPEAAPEKKVREAPSPRASHPPRPAAPELELNV